MINIPDARAQLAKIIGDAVGSQVQVYPSGTSGTVTFPAVVLGMPYGIPPANWCNPGITWPVGVVVSRPGTNDADPIDQLDRLWPLVFTTLRDLTARDSSLGGICNQSSVQDTTQMSQFDVQGQSYPAQLISLDLYG